MEPVLLIALVLAFGLTVDGERAPMPPDLVALRLQEALLVLVLQVAVIWTIGRLLAWRVSPPRGGRSARRRLAHATTFLGIMTVASYAYLILVVEWPEVVNRGLALRDWILVDELAVLSPFLILRLITWWSLLLAERRIESAVREPNTDRRTGPRLLHKARQSMGLALPAILAYCLLSDLAERAWPSAMRSSFAPVASLLVMGGLVLALAPALVRLAWPTHPLPPGSLRDRLERAAARLGFRYTDILVWETRGTFLNAGVTGAFPWFRYVLLTDRLIGSLDEREVEAVFGHEVGHIAQRHLTSLGLFFVGSLGVMALAGEGVRLLTPSTTELRLVGSGGIASWSQIALESVGLAIVLGGYVFFVFGSLSRRFERQADIFGCRAVSCGRPDCPPHRDLGLAPDVSTLPAKQLCPVGIRIFANALSNVALLNGIEPRKRSWRHGSIAQRIAFLEQLESQPQRERHFQNRLRLFRVLLATGLLAALLLAGWTGALSRL